MTPPRVLVLAIASGGEVYDSMKSVADAHADRAPPNVHVRFVYGAAPADVAPIATRAPSRRDVTFRAVPESLHPGVMRKTLLALKTVAEHEEYDYVVRTNLSTFFDWTRLCGWLADAPRRDLVAGTVDGDCGSWMCGCCIVMSADVVRRVVHECWEELWDAPELDDVALSAALRRLVPGGYARLPRLDVHFGEYPSYRVHTEGLALTDALAAVFAVRVMSRRHRGEDVAVLRHLGRLWDGRVDVHPLTLLHAAQCGALVDPEAVAARRRGAAATSSPASCT